MSILKRSGIVQIRAGTALFAIIAAVLGAAYLHLPERQMSSAARIVANPTSLVWHKPQASPTHSTFAAPRPQTQKPAPLTPYSHGDTALQNLWRICAAPNSADVKVTTLDRYARTRFAVAGIAAKDSLERIADTAFDYDPAMARAAALSSSVPEIQLAAITNLAHGTDVQAPATLALVATYPDVDIRRGAIEGLGQLLKDDPQVRVSLAYLKQAETDPDNAMLIEDWLANATETTIEH